MSNQKFLVEEFIEEKRNTSKFPKKYFSKLFKIFILLFLWGWILIFVSEISLYFLITCQKNICPRLVGVVAFYVQKSSPVLGAEFLSNQLGFSMTKTASLLMAVSQSRNETYSLAKKILPILYMLTGSGQTISSQQIALLSQNINELNNKLSFVVIDFTQISSKDPLADRLLKIEKKITLQKNVVSQSSQLVSDLPKLLSLDKKSTYAIVFLDNSENRGTGGYLDSLALISIDNGKILDIQLHDSYSLDRQLRGQINPPDSLKLATGETSWYLRDANWGVSFPEAAQKIAWFVEKESGIYPDLVISVNLDTITSLLDTFGPVDIPGLGNVSKSTFFNKYLEYLKKNTTGSSFVAGVVQAMLIRKTPISKIQITNFLYLLVSQLQEKQISIYPNRFSAPALSALGWSGDFVPPFCRSIFPCQIDYYYSQDNNVGANKVSPFIKKITHLDLKFENSKLSTVVKIIYENQNKDSAWPLGTFKNYVRFYFPTNVIPDSILIDQKPILKTNYQISTESGFLVLSAPLSVPPLSKKEMIVTYHQQLPKDPRFHYQLDLPNQPGNLNDSLMFTITYPKNWYVVSGNKFLIASERRFSYNTIHSGYEKIDLDIVPYK